MVSTQRTAGDRRRASLGRAWIAAVLIAADVALALVAAVAWRAAPDDVDLGAITVLGASAIVGIPVLATVLLANVRAARGAGAAAHPGPAGRPAPLAGRLAVLGQSLALVLLLGVVVAAVAVVVVRGVTESFDLADSCTAATAVFDALLAVLVAALTGRAAAR